MSNPERAALIQKQSPSTGTDLEMITFDPEYQKTYKISPSTYEVENYIP